MRLFCSTGELAISGACALEKLKSKKLKYSVGDPDAEENHPRVWYIWRGNAIMGRTESDESVHMNQEPPRIDGAKRAAYRHPQRAVSPRAGPSEKIVSAPPYQLTIDGFSADHFRVHALTGKETLSEAYAFDIVVTGEAGEDVERAGLARRATLTLNTGEAPRAFYGVVAAVRLLEVHHADHTIKYAIRLVPRLWLLKRKKRTRIFQKMRVTDIVTAVLTEAGIATRWQLTRAYPEREYCTQYEETDYRFVQRLLAEAGIYFYFFGGGPVDGAALAADAAIGAAASVGGSLVGEIAGSAVGSLVAPAAGMAETLIPGDTIVCADDAGCYPPVAGDDPAALAASTAAALAPAIGDALGAGSGIAGAVIGTASAVAGKLIAGITEGGREAPVLYFLRNEEAKIGTYDKITHFTLRNSVRSSAATFRDYDPARPMVRLQSTAVSTQPFPPSPFEAAAQAIAMGENAASTVSSAVPGAASAMGEVASFADTAVKVAGDIGGALGQKVPFEVYDHHSPFLFPKWAFADEEAPRMLRQKRRRASIATGEGGCSDFSPGHRFALQDHPAGQLDGGYVVTSVAHRGETRPAADGAPWRVYWNHFECAPAEMAYPPPRPKRKSVQVSLTATVVGPPGAEIHVDAMGQIKVQFHWDRDGKYDDKSSCWIRVMQPWAGAAWGEPAPTDPADDPAPTDPFDPPYGPAPPRPREGAATTATSRSSVEASTWSRSRARSEIDTANS